MKIFFNVIRILTSTAKGNKANSKDLTKCHRIIQNFLAERLMPSRASISTMLLGRVVHSSFEIDLSEWLQANVRVGHSWVQDMKVGKEVTRFLTNLIFCKTWSQIEAAYV